MDNQPPYNYPNSTLPAPEPAPAPAPYIPYEPPVPPKKQHKGIKRMGIVLLFLLFLGAAGYGVYAYMQNATLQNDLQNEKNNSQALEDENKKLKDDAETKSNQPVAQPQAKTITEALPNGKKMTYDDTAGNRNILWWSTDGSEDTIAISHKGYQQFLATLDSGIIESVCGPDDAPRALKYNMVYGNLDTTTKKIADVENVSCVSLLATEENTDEASRAKAQKVLDGIKSDVTAFVKNVTIQ